MKKIKFTYSYKNELIKEVILGIKLRKNGMIYLKNRKTEVTSIPFIFGNIQTYKSRIGVSANNDLIIHILHHSTGAGLFIIYLHSENDNYTYYFRRVLQKNV